jgi:hypothetical protein
MLRERISRIPDRRALTSGNKPRMGRVLPGSGQGRERASVQLGGKASRSRLLGSEGAGIRLLFLSPTPIRTVLLAKNLLHSILFALVGLVAGTLVCLRLGGRHLWCWQIPARGLFLRCRAI